MKRKIKDKLPELIKLTKDNPGKFTKVYLSHELDLSLSTVHKYTRKLKLPTKEKANQYSEEQIEFVRTNAPVMGLSEIARNLGLERYQVQAIGDKLNVKFYVRRKEKQETEFFQHDDYYSRRWLIE